MYESDNEQSKREFIIMKSITTRTTTLKMTILYHAIRICKECYLKKAI